MTEVKSGEDSNPNIRGTAGKGAFDVVVVHTLDRWARNLKVMLDSVSTLSQYGVGLVSITEKLDWSTPEGRLVARTLGSFGEFFSDMLGTHVKKGISERAYQGNHLGNLPFGYESCRPPERQDRKQCDPEHSGEVHLVEEEAQAVAEVFQQYSSGMTTLSQMAIWLNGKGFRTRNMHHLPDAQRNLSGGPRLFTIASVRGIIHNPFYMGKVKHRDQLLPGAHEPIVSEDLFNLVQSNFKRNSGRSETLDQRPAREYLLKGLIRCAHCMMPMWAQTYVNGHRYYREQYGARSAGYCVGRSGFIPCHVPDDQIGKIIGAIVLPEKWMDRVLAQVHLTDEVKKVQEERKKVQQRLQRLSEVYLDGLRTRDDYLREKRRLEDQLVSLVVPGVDAAREAGKLLEHLLSLWEQANLTERRKLWLSILDAVYVDTVEENRVVAIRPKPAFMPLFEVATTREGSGVLLVNEKELPPATDESPEASNPCLWWRRGRVELPVQRIPR